jgi:hypothetical protein
MQKKVNEGKKHTLKRNEIIIMNQYQLLSNRIVLYQQNETFLDVNEYEEKLDVNKKMSLTVTYRYASNFYITTNE